MKTINTIVNLSLHKAYLEGWLRLRINQTRFNNPQFQYETKWEMFEKNPLRNVHYRIRTISGHKVMEPIFDSVWTKSIRRAVP